MPEPIRIIAWGNKGRQDDGAALVVAERLAERFAGNGDVVVQQCHQLGPEVVEDLHRCRLAFFVDADSRRPGDEPLITPLEPAECGGLDTHHCPPDVLLGLTAALGLNVPESWLVAIPGHIWDFGEQFSEPTRRAMIRAEDTICSRIAHLTGQPLSGGRPHL